MCALHFINNRVNISILHSQTLENISDSANRALLSQLASMTF